MKKRKGRPLITLRGRIIAIVALCWLVPTAVLGVYTGSILVGALRDKTEQALILAAAHGEELVVDEIDRILTKSRDVTYDEQLTDYAAQYRAGTMRYEEFFMLSRTYWHKMFQREWLVDSAVFFLTSEPDLLIHTYSDVAQLLSFRENVLPPVLSLGETIDTASVFIQQDGRLYHVRNLFNRKMERFGMLTLGIDTQRLFSPLFEGDPLWKDAVDVALDSYTYTARTDYPFRPDSMPEGLYEEGSNLYYGRRVQTVDYTFSYRIRVDKGVAFGEIDSYYQTLLVLILLLLPTGILVLIFIHQRITRPLHTLSQATKRMAEGELGITVSTDGTGEIGSLGASFNAMSQQIQRLIDESYREELALRDARIASLQSRINPHFLNNALELINWQARMEGSDTVSQMIEALSTLINAALDRSNQRTVPLKSELEVANAYFYFIQQRFGDRLAVQEEIDPDSLTVQVPRLVVQTLLENAVEHGISPAGGGTIRLRTELWPGYLAISVYNNGRQITPEDRARIDALLGSANREGGGEHFGIQNVNLRLQLLYGGRASLTITSNESGETVARIVIPHAGAYRVPPPPEGIKRTRWTHESPAEGPWEGSADDPPEK